MDPGSAVRVDQHGDEGLRHPRASPAPIDPQRFDALAPDGVGKRGRDVDHLHERAEFAPMLRRMRSQPLWRKKLVLGGIEPIQNGRFNNRACSGAPQVAR